MSWADDSNGTGTGSDDGGKWTEVKSSSNQKKTNRGGGGRGGRGSRGSRGGGDRGRGERGSRSRARGSYRGSNRGGANTSAAAADTGSGGGGGGSSGGSGAGTESDRPHTHTHGRGRWGRPKPQPHVPREHGAITGWKYAPREPDEPAAAGEAEAEAKAEAEAGGEADAAADAPDADETERADTKSAAADVKAEAVGSNRSAPAAAAAAGAAPSDAIPLSRRRDMELSAVLDDYMAKPLVKLVIGYAGYTLLAAFSTAEVELWDAQSFVRLGSFGADPTRQQFVITGCAGVAGTRQLAIARSKDVNRWAVSTDVSLWDVDINTQKLVRAMPIYDLPICVLNSADDFPIVAALFPQPQTHIQCMYDVSYVVYGVATLIVM